MPDRSPSNADSLQLQLFTARKKEWWPATADDCLPQAVTCGLYYCTINFNKSDYNVKLGDRDSAELRLVIFKIMGSRDPSHAPFLKILRIICGLCLETCTCKRLKSVALAVLEL